MRAPREDRAVAAEGDEEVAGRAPRRPRPRRASSRVPAATSWPPTMHGGDAAPGQALLERGHATADRRAAAVTPPARRGGWRAAAHGRTGWVVATQRADARGEALGRRGRGSPAAAARVAVRDEDVGDAEARARGVGRLRAASSSSTRRAEAAGERGLLDRDDAAAARGQLARSASSSSGFTKRASTTAARTPSRREALGGRERGQAPSCRARRAPTSRAVAQQLGPGRSSSGCGSASSGDAARRRRAGSGSRSVRRSYATAVASIVRSSFSSRGAMSTMSGSARR